MKKSGRSIHRFGVALAAFALCGLTATIASATPSTIVWIPSVDIQPYKTFHMTYDTYVRAKENLDGSRTGAIVDYGLTAGILPFEKIQAELGFDLIDQPGDAGKYPFFFNGKIGVPEDNTWKPAFAVGIYNAGTKSGDLRLGKDPVATNQNIVYAIAGKTLPVFGRFEAGYYVGNKKVLVDENAKSDEKGVLLSWDRTISEISDKLWAGVDYQGGKNALGALNFGVSWAFAKNVSIIFGYDVYTKKATGGQNTYTVQLDINFP
jgi:hypothetical protein